MRTRTAPSAEPARPQLATRVDPQGNTIQTCRPSGVWRRRLPTASAIMISATAHVHVGPNLGSIWAYRPTCALCPFPLSWGLSRCACTFTVVFSCLWCLSCIMDRADGVMHQAGCRRHRRTSSADTVVHASAPRSHMYVLRTYKGTHAWRPNPRGLVLVVHLGGDNYMHVVAIATRACGDHGRPIVDHVRLWSAGIDTFYFGRGGDVFLK